MRISDAVQQFREAAIAKGEFTTPARADHVLHRSMAEAWQALQAQGGDGRSAFQALLADHSPHVRLWVASQLLAEGVSEAAKVLEAEIFAGGVDGLSAKLILEEWRAGRLASPFEVK
jgi:hypothetical protein